LQSLHSDKKPLKENFMQTQRYETLQLEYLAALPDFDPEVKIARIVLNRPQVLNALNTHMGHELIDVLKTLETDDAVRVVILTGAGRAFCAGADLKERLGLTDEQWLEQRQVFLPMFSGLFEFKKPVIAAVNGPAFGGGTEIALNCDFVAASSEAVFALPEVSRGIMPGGGGTQLLMRLVGQNFARWMMFSGVKVSAAEAYRVGLAQQLIEGDYATFQEAVVGLARQIAANSPLSVRMVKQAVREGLNLGILEGFAAEVRAYNILIPSLDRREGMLAFNEKRPPRFLGR